MQNVDELKKLVGEEAANLVKDGMKVGLGSGSTVYWMVKRLGERVQDGLNITAIPTSNTTAKWAVEFGVPLTDFSKVQQLDIAIDGADEVDKNLQLIKGGGGALLREKVVAAAAKEFIVIVDESKLVSHLGAFPLAVEVTPFGWEITSVSIADLGGTPTLRHKDGEVFVTDNGNYILDCSFNQILDPEALQKDLKMLVGVVETGLFVGMADKVIVGKADGVSSITK
ncbi:ribose-5-phosphate isomerase RpiA [Oceanobacillus polygoni]|uniref:Ribose-5-phosphate isomerase A n=1 Tax=Oceanobacillus polygoni TaxID=1235259 RepID=A0A9X0YP28_9BACI|nr:ribose-5-phosphate isomerase RpiA [Oceanobacillus polygoni]MBP2076129.1 ribose 5-phosphate isomerase A [Oceanobacillus polygoni]